MSGDAIATPTRDEFLSRGRARLEAFRASRKSQAGGAAAPAASSARAPLRSDPFAAASDIDSQVPNGGDNLSDPAARHSEPSQSAATSFPATGAPRDRAHAPANTSPVAQHALDEPLRERSPSAGSSSAASAPAAGSPPAPALANGGLPEETPQDPDEPSVSALQASFSATTGRLSDEVDSLRRVHASAQAQCTMLSAELSSANRRYTTLAQSKVELDSRVAESEKRAARAEDALRELQREQGLRTHGGVVSPPPSGAAAAAAAGGDSSSSSSRGSSQQRGARRIDSLLLHQIGETVESLREAFRPLVELTDPTDTTRGLVAAIDQHLNTLERQSSAEALPPPDAGENANPQLVKSLRSKILLCEDHVREVQERNQVLTQGLERLNASSKAKIESLATQLDDASASLETAQVDLAGARQAEAKAEQTAREKRIESAQLNAQHFSLLAEIEALSAQVQELSLAKKELCEALKQYKEQYDQVVDVKLDSLDSFIRHIPHADSQRELSGLHAGGGGEPGAHDAGSDHPPGAHGHPDEPEAASAGGLGAPQQPQQASSRPNRDAAAVARAHLASQRQLSHLRDEIATLRATVHELRSVNTELRASKARFGTLNSTAAATATRRHSSFESGGGSRAGSTAGRGNSGSNAAGDGGGSVYGWGDPVKETPRGNFGLSEVLENHGVEEAVDAYVPLRARTEFGDVYVV